MISIKRAGLAFVLVCMLAYSGRGATSLVLGATYGGSIALPGQTNLYTFNGTPGQRLFFDALDLDSTALNVTLLSPGRVSLYQQNDDYDSGPLVLPEPGVYSLVFNGNGSTTGTYQFRLLDLGAAPLLTLGTAFSDQLSPPLSCNTYQFVGKRGQQVAFQTLSYSTNLARWQLVSPANVILASGQLTANLGPVTLPMDGAYCLMVIGTGTGITPLTYQLVATDLSDTPVAASGFGTVRSGTVSANQTNSFTYAAPAGLPVYFDSLDAAASSLVVYVFDPTGTVAFTIGEGFDGGPFILPRSGTYTVNVWGPGGVSGNYNFRLLDLTSSPPLTLNTGVSNTLALPYQTDVYQINGTAGQRLYFDSLVTANLNAHLSLLGPDGARPLDSAYLYDAGPFTLAFTGTYYLFVQSGTASSGSYNFNLLDIATQPALPVNSDLTGTLPPNSSQIYRLPGSSGETIYFYGKSANPGGGSCSLYDPHNVQLNGSPLGGDFSVTLPYDGTYAVVFTAAANAITYSNQFSKFSYFTNALALGTLVTNNIFNPGDQVVYTFSGTMGQRLYYDGVSPYISINFNLISPGGAIIASGNVNPDVGPITLTQTGTYTLIFQGSGHVTGPISFQLFDLASQPALPINQDLVGNLAPNFSTLYQFDATNGQQLYFNAKSISAGGAAWYLYGPNNAFVGGATLGSDFELVLGNSGKYLVALVNGANPVTYSNQVNSFSYTTNTLTLGTPVTNNLVQPGDQLFYTFNGTAGQRLYFDSLVANYLSISFTLFAPGGTQVTSGNTSSDLGPFSLPQTGSYLLQIVGGGDVVGPVNFNLLDVGAQPTLPLNTDLVGSLAPNLSVVYQFAGVSGQQLYFNSEGETGNGANWVLYGPDNKYENGNVLYADFEQTLPLTGSYVVVLSAANNPISYTNQVNTFSYATNSLTLGNAVAPTLLHPGDQIFYSFNGTAGQRVYFDSRQTNFNYVSATLYSPAGATVFSVNSSSDAGPFTLTQSGTYRLVLDGQGDATGFLAFNLVDLAAATPETVGSTVTDSLSDQTETKFYKFNGTAGQRLNLHSVSASGAQANWGLIGPTDAMIGQQAAVLNDIGVVVLPASGTYTLAVIGLNQNAAAVSYQLAVTDVSDVPVASSGFGTVNSGNLASGQTNTFTYTATAGTPVFFDSQDASGQNLVVEFYDPFGTQVFAVGEISDIGPYLLQRSGTYTLRVRGVNGASGNYSFRLLDLSASPTLTLNSPVTGTLSNPYQADAYQLTTVAGQSFYYDGLTNEVNYPPVTATLLDPRNQAIGVNGNFSNDRGPFMIQYPGTCYMIVQSPRSAASPYSFRLLDLGSQAMLPINTAVTNTLDIYPAQAYRYNGTAGTHLYFHGQPTNPSGFWALYDANNQGLSGGSAGLSQDFEVTLPFNGPYTLVLNGSASAAGTEIFQVNDFSYITNSYTIGSSVFDAITRPGERRVYTFTGKLGQQLVYDSLTNDPSTGDTIIVTLFNPQGAQEGPINSRMSFDRGPFTLQQSGTYTLVVDGYGPGLGPFAFRILDVAAQPVLPVNTAVSNTLDVYAMQVYQYAGTAGQRLYFRGQPSNPGGFWTLYDPNNATVPAGSAGAAGDFEVTLPLSGTYALLVASYSSTPGPEAFQVNDYNYFTNAYTIGNTVVDSINRPGERRFYAFTGTLGQHLIYDAITNDPPGPYAISVSLINPQGLTENSIGGRFSTDQGPFTLQQSGTFMLVFDGNASAVGTFGFRLLDVGAQPVLPVGSVVTSTLDPYPMQVYRYSGTNGQHLYFKGNPANTSGGWHIYDPNDYAVPYGGSSLSGDFQVVLPATGTYAITLSSYTTVSSPEIFQVNLFNGSELPTINQAPVLAHIGPQVLGAGVTVAFTAQATDPDGNSLLFSLDPGSPADAVINPTTGVFSWFPPVTGVSSVTPVTVRVTDNGNPFLSDAETVFVEVIAGPSMITVKRVGSVANVYYNSAPNKHYRLQYKNNLIEPAWTTLGSDVTAVDLITIQPDATIGTNDHRFYRVQALDPL